MDMTQHDQRFLLHALRLALRHHGRTAPNPSVGCVIVHANQILAAATTAIGGRPHAETQALAQCNPRGATVYVSLEPCAHVGGTPSCAQALIDAGVARVVYACEDADPRVAGRGAAMLRAAGIVVDWGGMPQAAALYRGFFRRVRHGLPEVTMKLATSVDGQMSNPTGARWITGEQARRHGHALRLRADTLLTGIGTVLADDPELNLRLPGIAHARLQCVVLDRQLQLPLKSKLVARANQLPLRVITTHAAIEQKASHATELRERGVIIYAQDTESFAPRAVLALLGAAGCNQLLIEAGPILSAAFLEARAVDRVYHYQAPQSLGGARSPLHALLSQLCEGRAQAQFSLGADRLAVYELASCLPD